MRAVEVPRPSSTRAQHAGASRRTRPGQTGRGTGGSRVGSLDHGLSEICGMFQFRSPALLLPFTHEPTRGPTLVQGETTARNRVGLIRQGAPEEASPCGTRKR